mmetsp:Transcript_22651/g.67437  ORF Transcript_22651/g.67437 Transcript_22651/m.67437 type:complete len:303 (+) Transcript_22651:2145-3053(+)
MAQRCADTADCGSCRFRPPSANTATISPSRFSSSTALAPHPMKSPASCADPGKEPTRSACSTLASWCVASACSMPSAASAVCAFHSRMLRSPTTDSWTTAAKHVTVPRPRPFGSFHAIRDVSSSGPAAAISTPRAGRCSSASAASAAEGSVLDSARYKSIGGAAEWTLRAVPRLTNAAACGLPVASSCVCAVCDNTTCAPFAQSATAFAMPRHAPEYVVRAEALLILTASTGTPQCRPMRTRSPRATRTAPASTWLRSSHMPSMRLHSEPNGPVNATGAPVLCVLPMEDCVLARCMLPSSTA